MVQPMKSVDPHGYRESDADEAPFGNWWVFAAWVFLLVVIGALALAEVPHLTMYVAGAALVAGAIHVMLLIRKRRTR